MRIRKWEDTKTKCPLDNGLGDGVGWDKTILMTSRNTCRKPFKYIVSHFLSFFKCLSPKIQFLALCFLNHQVESTVEI